MREDVAARGGMERGGLVVVGVRLPQFGGTGVNVGG